jgi:hypothetical protein
MITWVLFVLLLEAERYYVMPQGHYMTMEECFEARDFYSNCTTTKDEL